MRVLFTAVVLLAMQMLLFGSTVHNFDKVLSQHAADVVIQPPPGKTWIIESGSFVMDEPKPGMFLIVYKLDALADSNCNLCDNLIHVDLGTIVWVPIVSGYTVTATGTLRGQEKPITLVYPQMLRLHVSGLTTGSVRTWTRFSILETATQRFR